jgi:hypothetical protein
MNPRTLDPSLKKNTPIPDKEFEFQPEPKRSGREKGSIRLGPRIRGYAILTSLSSGERKKKNPPVGVFILPPYQRYSGEEVSHESLSHPYERF